MRLFFSGILLIFLLLWLYFPAAGGNLGNDKKPNILIILTDDQGYNDVGYYGNKEVKTPNIDNLCEDGMRFDNFYANSAVCSPSRASLLSGRYPERVGVPGVIRTKPQESFGYLKPDAILIPQKLKEAGYQTAVIGKWHLGLEHPNLPNDKGVDYFHGFLGDMMDDYYTHLRTGYNYMRYNSETIMPVGHATDLFTDWAVRYIRFHEKKEKPFFLYLAYNAPHVPVQPPKEWLNKVQKEQPGLSPERAKLVALIDHLDFNIGKVVDALKQTGQYENTLIVFTSDNGGDLKAGANNGNLRGGKTMMYEGGLRVPACMKWSGKIKPGSVTGQRAMLMDIYPTVCEAAGVPVKNEIDGVSLYNLITGTTNTLPDRPLYYVFREGNLTHGGHEACALRDGDWKLVLNTPFEPYQLFNMSSDPMEKTDLKETQKKEFNKLFMQMGRHIQQGGRVPWQKP